MLYRSTRCLTIAALLSLLASTIACGDSVEDQSFPPVILDAGTAEQVAVATGGGAGKRTPLGVGVGEAEQTGAENRRALLTILEGSVSRDERQPYSAELVRTVDAELYRDIDDETKGPKQWITRASVLDKNGDVLWSDRINSFFQLLEYLKTILDQTASVDFSLFQVYGFADSEYPELLDFAVQVPIGIEGAHEYVLEVPDTEGNYYEVARFKIDKLVEEAEPPRFEAEVEPLVESGPSADRIDVAILGDGYTKDQKMEFMADARAIADEFALTQPFRQHMHLFNFHAVWTPSKESGAGYDCRSERDTDCKRGFRDTVYNYVFVVSALIDKLDLDFPSASSRVAMPLEVSKMFEIAALAKYDEILLVSNTDRRSGFAGMYAGVLTAFDERDSFPDVAVHEFGHSFGVLGDEYFIESDPCLDNSPRIPLPANISKYADRDKLKWSAWVADETSLPTPAEERGEDLIGAFERAYNCKELYRPNYRCKMRSSSGEFCSVCSEQLVRRLYNDVDLLRAGFPRIEREENGALTIASGVRRDGRLVETTWRLDGKKLSDATTLKLGSGDVPSRWTKLVLEADESSTFVRKDDPRLTETHQWWVRTR